jgi:hypothetical protein
VIEERPGSAGALLSVGVTARAPAAQGCAAMGGLTRFSFVADHPKDLKIRWRAPRKLEIVYDEARFFQFSNFWHSKEVDDFKYVVELQLSPTGSSQLPSTAR